MDVAQFKEHLRKLQGMGLDPGAARIVQFLLDQLEEEGPDPGTPPEEAIKNLQAESKALAMLSRIVEKALPMSPSAAAEKFVAEANLFAQRRKPPGGPGLAGPIGKIEPMDPELAKRLDAEIAAVVERRRRPGRAGREW